MRVVFMGTPRFAVPSLEVCARDHELVAVYTRPDAVSGRGKRLRPTPVKEAALRLGAPVLEPRTLRDSDVQDHLAALSPDVIVVAAYGLILPREVLDIPPLGCVNVHASLLPRWRGAAPVERAILAGDDVTGVSIMQMEEGLDTGPFCVQERVDIAEKDADTLTAELAGVGAEALARALVLIEARECRWMAQDDALATYAAKITKEETLLMPTLPADELLRRVRASSRRAPARLSVCGHQLTVVAASSAENESAAPGTVTRVGDAPVLGAHDGAVRLDVVRPEGRGDMPAADWMRGAHLDNEPTWGAL